MSEQDRPDVVTFDVAAYEADHRSRKAVVLQALSEADQAGVKVSDPQDRVHVLDITAQRLSRVNIALAANGMALSTREEIAELERDAGQQAFQAHYAQHHDAYVAQARRTFWEAAGPVLEAVNYQGGPRDQDKVFRAINDALVAKGWARLTNDRILAYLSEGPPPENYDGMRYTTQAEHDAEIVAKYNRDYPPQAAGPERGRAVARGHRLHGARASARPHH